jgi:RNA polymerase sigma-70 factor (ECF subfamily)
MLNAADSFSEALSPSRDLDRLFRQHAQRLKRSVRVHMDQRLSGRLDPSDVIQDVFLEAASRYAEYQRKPNLPPYLWLRFLTIQRLALVHRTNLRVQARDIRREQRFGQAGSGTNSAALIAALLVGRNTSPSQAVHREQRRERVQRALEAIDPLDREVLLLRHFEQLSNQEAALVLNLNESAASKRYIRALTRMKKVLAEVGGCEA